MVLFWTHNLLHFLEVPIPKDNRQFERDLMFKYILKIFAIRIYQGVTSMWLPGKQYSSIGKWQ